MEHSDFPGKKFRVQWSVKKVMLTVFLNMNESISLDFFDKDAT